MKTSYISKLFYNKYAYKLVLSMTMPYIDYKSQKNDWTVFNCKRWLADNNIKYRMYSDINTIKGRKRHSNSTVTITSKIYVDNKASYDLCLHRWKSVITEISIPRDDNHLSLLKDNATVVIRDTLIYKKYKYAITLIKKWNDDLSTVFEWIEDNFINQTDTSRAKLSKRGWRPRLYLYSNDDLVLFKLTWAEYIKDITYICFPSSATST